GFVTRYGHLSKYNVKVGQHVKRGDVIAFMGSTGRSTGPHLHYEVWRNNRPLDPRKYILNWR
ncbi:MAG: M23 family metallopeptidase, partial [Candidatus Zixiibacteriota bacterium]